MTTAAQKRIQQRQVLALLLALGALVLPTSGALNYLDFFRIDGGDPPWITPFAGASNASDLVGPVLLVGALALGVLATRDPSWPRSVSVPVLGTVIAVAALSQGVAFAVSGFDLVISDRYAVPETAAWMSAKWATFVRLLVQAAVCAAVIAFGMRWLDPDHRRDPS